MKSYKFELAILITIEENVINSLLKLQSARAVNKSAIKNYTAGRCINSSESQNCGSAHRSQLARSVTRKGYKGVVTSRSPLSSPFVDDKETAHDGGGGR